MKHLKKLLAVCLLVVVAVVAAAPAAEAASKGYQFKNAGVTVSVHDKAATFIKKAGKPIKKTKSASCAYDGQDIRYQYKNFVLTTYTNKIGGTEYVHSIEFKTKDVKTKEGIKIGSTEKAMLKAYGKKKPSFGRYSYRKGKMELSFTTKDGKVTGVEYIAY